MERRVSVRLPACVLSEIDRRARRRGRARAEEIRFALSAYVALPEGVFEARPIEVRPIDRVRDLVGSVGGLPSDLTARSGDYLADFGRRK